jgi:hypothetical protein
VRHRVHPSESAHQLWFIHKAGPLIPVITQKVRKKRTRKEELVERGASSEETRAIFYSCCKAKEFFCTRILCNGRRIIFRPVRSFLLTRNFELEKNILLESLKLG